ncbi:MAG: branched-chain amino acid aminotransferase [Planctomycetaceae bacterium]
MGHNFLSVFLRQEAGFVLSSEALLLGTSVVLGLLVGIVSVRDSLVEEFEDFSDAMGFLNQSYTYTGVAGNGNSSTSDGGLFSDSLDGDDGTVLLVLGEEPET